MTWLKTGVLLAFLTISAGVYAGGFHQDASKPTPEMNLQPLQMDIKPASHHSEQAWASYNAPIRQCIQGDTILPAANNKLLNFLFSNNANSNAVMSIKGRQGADCQIDFSEGTQLKTCRLSPVVLNFVMKSLLNPTQFDQNSALSQRLARECQLLSES